jgi:hypothetical protein
MSCLLPLKSFQLIHLSKNEEEKIRKIFEEKKSINLIIESVKSIEDSKKLIGFLFEFYKV